MMGVLLGTAGKMFAGYLTANPEVYFTAVFIHHFRNRRLPDTHTSPATPAPPRKETRWTNVGCPGPASRNGSLRFSRQFSPQHTHLKTRGGLRATWGQGGGARDPSVARAFHQDGSAKRARPTSSPPLLAARTAGTRRSGGKNSCGTDCAPIPAALNYSMNEDASTTRNRHDPDHARTYAGQPSNIGASRKAKKSEPDNFLAQITPSRAAEQDRHYDDALGYFEGGLPEVAGRGRGPWRFS